MGSELAVCLEQCEGRAADSELCDGQVIDLERTADSKLSDVSDGRAADSGLRDERAEVREERATGVEEDNLSTGIRELGMLTFVE